METSDSEYFESADEDFESDYEEREKQKQNVRQSVNDKIEPELCKLTINERHESKADSTQKTGDYVKDIETIAQKIKVHRNIEKSQSDSFIKECKDTRISNKIKVEENLKCDIDESREKFTQNQSESENLSKEISKNIQKDTLDQKTLSVCEKSEETSHLEVKNTAKEPIESISRSESTELEPLKDLDKDAKTIDIKQKLPIELETEDNLWDDDEIDWGSEAAKEESQKTEQYSPNSKNEDSGWDDFDAEWESESHTSNQVCKNDQIDSKSIKVEKKSNNPETMSTSSIKENHWDDDDEWESVEKPEEKQKENGSSWGGWGWGVSSLLNSATQSVSSLTTHVSQGISTVLESGIGIPEPEEMARINKLRLEEGGKEKGDTDQESPHDNSPSTPVAFGLGNLVSGVSQLTKFVESTGTKVITGGLDTLEAIGKKTVEVLQEGDPGLKKKRAFLKLDTGKPNLSQILREAKERTEDENPELAQSHIEVKRVKNYESLFDDHQGLVHLEALEMLSKLCNIKLDNLNQSLSGEALKDMQETLEQVKELCELPDDEEDDKVSVDEAKEILSNAVKEIGIPISYDKLFAVFDETNSWLKSISVNVMDDVELHQQAIETLAQLTALAVEQFHKTGELLLVKEHRSTADEADSLVQITTTVRSLIVCEAGKFTDKLGTIENSNKDKITEHITNIFFEAANSGTYIQDAFQLLIPVLQVGAV